MCARSHTGGLTNERGACCSTSSLRPTTIASVQPRTEASRSAIAVWGGTSTLTVEHRTGDFARVDPQPSSVSTRAPRSRQPRDGRVPPALELGDGCLTDPLDPDEAVEFGINLRVA